MWPNGKKCAVLLTFDFDAESSWEAEGLDTPTYLSRGQYGARVGVPRILSLLKTHDIPATFFIPGITAERYTKVVQDIQAHGHEIGHHGHTHHSPVQLNEAEEQVALEKGIVALEKITGQRPRGYRSPSWDLSHHSISLFQTHNFLYDSSLMGDDFQPYLLEDKGTLTNVVELPVSWELDDAPHFMFNFTPYRRGLAAPSSVYEIWATEFEGAYQASGIFVLTMHPQISGRYHRVKLLEQLIQHIASHDDIWFARCAEVAEAWQAGQGRE